MRERVWGSPDLGRAPGCLRTQRTLPGRISKCGMWRGVATQVRTHTTHGTQKMRCLHQDTTPTDQTQGPFLLMSPSFGDAQPALSMFYKRFFPILLSLNWNCTLDPAGNWRRSEVGQLEFPQPRISIDQVMFSIAVAILRFQLIAGTIIFASTPRRLLPRFPYNLASDISFFHTSSALSDIARTANMSSAMRSQHFERLGGTYGYGRFTGSYGEKHVGIERMSLIGAYREAVVTTRANSTTPERTTMVTTVTAVSSASSSLPAEGVVSKVPAGAWLQPR